MGDEGLVANREIASPALSEKHMQVASTSLFSFMARAMVKRRYTRCLPLSYLTSTHRHHI